MQRLATLALFAILVAFMAVPSALAQRGGRLSPEELQERMTTQVQETIVALALEGDRAETVSAILLAQGQKQLELRREAFEGRSGGQGQRQGQAQGQRRPQEGMQAFRQKVVALAEQTASMLGQVLTDHEMESYQEIVASRQRPGRRGRGAQIQ